jgi:hypothetical protein
MRYWFYSRFMRLMHRHNWHYAPPCFPDGDTMLWCQWCGFRAVVKRAVRYPVPESERSIANAARELEDARWPSR